MSAAAVHIVLVHGACHGAWCWFKLKPLLEAAGHRVTALDLAASGIDRRSLQDLRSFADYSQPLLELMAAIPAEEKVVVVGHSLGGINISLAMEMYPHKIAVAVFLAAFLPGSTHPPSYVVDQFSKEAPAEEWLDTEFLPCDTMKETSLFFGPNMLSSKLYQLSSPEDVTLAKMLIRPSSLFREDLSKRSAFTKERYGSVKRVYAVCSQDMIIPESFQRWQIETNGVDEVKVLENADHMAMFSQPQELCQCLLEIANIYA
ncbi:salicylic acid-binding protein 2-like isoform X1 [Salvia miltiorrhiza]|uniref:salicylic acid-binding protein 2-like isoform X1 n=1 Tax=Salvia miltiorrhiza TaxID=226208 RepID=UPI0025AB61E4|nr:salicylic acid-binding protein 2-like isoform X1 [Salvia miltiorrhiza]